MPQCTYSTSSAKQPQTWGGGTRVTAGAMRDSQLRTHYGLREGTTDVLARDSEKQHPNQQQAIRYDGLQRLATTRDDALRLIS